MDKKRIKNELLEYFNQLYYIWNKKPNYTLPYNNSYNRLPEKTYSRVLKF